MQALIWFVMSATLAFPASRLADDSLYHLRSNWVTQAGDKITLSELSGKPVVIAMAYTGCTYSCPMVVSKMKEIEKDIRASGAEGYRMVMVSFDTKGDRPAQTAAYMKSKGLDPAQWTWLSADDDKTVRELAAALGVTYSKSGKKDFSHSNQISLLDKDGRLSSQINGVNADHGGLVKAVAVERKQP